MIKILVIPVAWSGESAQPFSEAPVVKTLRDYYPEACYGKEVFEFTVAPWQQTAQDVSSSSASAWNFVFEFRQSLKDAGLGDVLYAGFSIGAPFRYVIWLTTRAPAPGAKGFSAGTHMWVNCCGNDYAMHSAVHELGHSLGLSHPFVTQGALQFSDGAYQFPAPTDAPRGSFTELYDSCTAMGYEATIAHFSSREKALLGWIAPAVWDEQDRTYQLTPMAQAGGALYGIKIYSGIRVYWIEYRTNLGFDGIVRYVGDGIQIRVQGYGAQVYSQAWIDKRVFVPGERFTDGTVTIDVTAPGEVRIRKADQVPHAPPIIVEPNPTPEPTPEPPIPTGNAMTIASIQSKAATLVVGGISQAVKDALLADVNALVPDTGVPPTTGTRVPPAASLTAPDGGVWTLANIVGVNGDVRRNGALTGGKGSIIALDGAIVKVFGTDNGWWTNASGSWQRTTAPAP